MEYMEALRVVDILFPIFMAILGLHLWSLKKMYVSKKDFEDLKREIDSKLSKSDFKEFQQEHQKESRSLSERLVKIETHMENMSNTALEIKEYLFKRNRKS